MPWAVTITGKQWSVAAELELKGIDSLSQQPGNGLGLIPKSLLPKILAGRYSDITHRLFLPTCSIHRLIPVRLQIFWLLPEPGSG